jgi:hypothetical protein
MGRSWRPVAGAGAPAVQRQVASGDAMSRGAGRDIGGCRWAGPLPQCTLRFIQYF